MAVGIPLIVVLVALAPSHLKSSPVEVKKIPAVVEKKVFDKKLPPPEVGNADSRTVYDFVCHSELDYAIEDEAKITNQNWQVRLKVTRAKVTLELPITVWLSQIIPNRRADFEDGHAKICTRVYVDAHEPATAACKKVIGRTFFGQGNDLESAGKQAIAIAEREIKQQYAEAVDTRVKDVFVIYDFYAPTWKQSADVLVDRALQEYEIGKPRRLSGKSKEK